MNNYSIYLSTETEKYDMIEAVRASGAKLTGVSGCGTGYYIQIDATETQADYINRTFYSQEIHNMTADQIRAAWKNQRVTMGQVVTWQQRPGEIIGVC